MLRLFKETDNQLECLLCPHNCRLHRGKTGTCGARKNTGDKIELLTYGKISGYSLDPVEKKPLYHFFPGKKILSIGSYGCNMRCDFCQNYNISQKIPETLPSDVSPEKIVREALAIKHNIGVAFTYNEPVIWFEFMRDTAIEAKKSGLHTIMVSNGYVNREPLAEILQYIDAYNIDLKSFNKHFYKKLTGADIEPVKSALKQIAVSGKHLEITSLIIPGQNDDERAMALQTEWIAGELGKDVPLHLSRYHPMYKRDDPSTPQATLNKLFKIASKQLNYVYVGNTFTDEGQSTRCPECETTVTIRSGYQTSITNLDKEGKCIKCGTLIYRNFTLSS